MKKEEGYRGELLDLAINFFEMENIEEINEFYHAVGMKPGRYGIKWVIA